MSQVTSHISMSLDGDVAGPDQITENPLGEGGESLQGGTTFHFMTDGIESARDHARAAAGDKDVTIDGGASAIQQYLAVGGGERLLENVGPTLEPVKEVASPAVTHMKHRVVR